MVNNTHRCPGNSPGHLLHICRDLFRQFRTIPMQRLGIASFATYAQWFRRLFSQRGLARAVFLQEHGHTSFHTRFPQHRDPAQAAPTTYTPGLTLQTIRSVYSDVGMITIDFCYWYSKRVMRVTRVTRVRAYEPP